ncbi:hypothetical protein FRX31_029428 [Thalictrum thalictroides]|uniref:Uncharacterized protein n=1 Tax=Thalictrum thalictroides TaxID=46969 RepID=A0A7J6V7I9_THATH|nr:hypothetical protein FRX31_029428 [Thalictrum thalictroides]
MAEHYYSNNHPKKAIREECMSLPFVGETMKKFLPFEESKQINVKGGSTDLQYCTTMFKIVGLQFIITMRRNTKHHHHEKEYFNS